MKGEAEVTIQLQVHDQRRLRATAAELQTMSELIQRYPAEAQLIMSALEDGLTLGSMQAMEAECSRSSDDRQTNTGVCDR
jgi:hypothetical protein